MKHPIDRRVHHRFDVSCWNMDQWIDISATRFNKQNRYIGFLAQSRSKNTPCRASSDDDIICFHKLKTRVMIFLFSGNTKQKLQAIFLMAVFQTGEIASKRLCICRSLARATSSASSWLTATKRTERPGRILASGARSAEMTVAILV